MKYKIDGLEPSKTISKVIDKDKFLEVRYLDGSNDVLEKTNDNMLNIKKQMYIQANKYTDTFSSKKEELTEKFKNIKDLSLMHLIMILTIIMFALVFIPQGVITVLLAIILTGLGVSFSSLLKGLYVCKGQLQDLEKYNLFIKEFEDKIQAFNNIMIKEASLKRTKSNKIEQIDIVNLDKYSLEEIKNMLLKTERYQLLTSNEDIESNLDITKNKTYTKRKNITNK